MDIKDTIKNRPSWMQLFFTEALLVAKRSIDTSSQVGAVIVNKDKIIISQGYNGPVRGMDVNDESIQHLLTTRPAKYKYMEDAERNAIFNAHLVGASVKDAEIYVTMFPCPTCAKAIVQSGIRKVNVLEQTASIYGDPDEATLMIFHKAGVKLEMRPVKPVVPITVRVAGKDIVIE